MKPKLLDLFCGAGGATKGYQRAGFYVVGVDIKPQPHYCGDEFVQADVMTVPWKALGKRFDAVHASPPCQAYSKATKHLAKNEYPELIEVTREHLKASRLPYVIENVPGAPLINPTVLCGAMFDLPLYRHRLFETSFNVPFLFHRQHGIRASRAGHYEAGTTISVAGNCAPIAAAREAMGIFWMVRDELAEAIPPAFTEFIGRALMGQKGTQWASASN